MRFSGPPRGFLRAGTGQLNPELAALTDLRFDTDAAAHAFGGFCHHGQPDSCALVICRRCALEDLKYALLVLWLNAHAIVSHEDRDPGVLLHGANHDPWRSFAGNKLN